MSVHAYQVYKQTQVQTASQGELLLMLFDGAIRFAHQARQFIHSGDLAAANAKLIRAQDIMTELMVSLDLEQGELAENLYKLYDFIHDCLVQANIKKDVDLIDQAIRFLTELRDTWRQVVAKGS
ncbi:MAG: flagellar export chaperone FliS [Firmicutes bacterium]|nr:flagellar export chaperone FliS [Bacillota bacterium]